MPRFDAGSALLVGTVMVAAMGLVIFDLQLAPAAILLSLSAVAWWWLWNRVEPV